MTNEMIFTYASWTAMVGWLILVIGPRRIKPLFWTAKYFIPFALSALYTSLLFLSMTGEGGGEIDFGSLAGVKALFTVESALLMGWIHYLAFDLFIGAWIAERADEAGIHRVIQPVFFFFTFMFGPMGLLLFLATRSALSLRAGK